MAYEFQQIQIIKFIVLLFIPILFLTSCNDNVNRSFHIDSVKSETIDTIFFDPTMLVVGMNILIKSDVVGEFQIDFQDGDSYNFTQKFQNKTDTSFYIEWYTSTVSVHYRPDSNLQGQSVDMIFSPHILY